MPITPYLDDFDVDPKTKRVLSDALELTRVSLGLGDDLANGIIAKQIVELAKTGERNPDRLCEGDASVAAHIRHDQPVKRRPWHTDRARVSRRMGGFMGGWAPPPGANPTPGRTQWFLQALSQIVAKLGEQFYTDVCRQSISDS